MKPNIEDQLMDYLMSGEATLELAAVALRTSGKRLARVARSLEQRGLLVSRWAYSHYGKEEQRWAMARTRKAA